MPWRTTARHVAPVAGGYRLTVDYTELTPQRRQVAKALTMTLDRPVPLGQSIRGGQLMSIATVDPAPPTTTP